MQWLKTECITKDSTESTQITVLTFLKNTYFVEQLVEYAKFVGCKQ